ncbi:putative alpha beta-hydrolase [Diaporthe ampelina]|uniref:Putative alpha beta-hydrolase n=1 Tax=Diaporthe ampelina TaxID=1214573 RepID=A0A0G2FGQ2_9PEZI|nr:putative alpha beta-hydrolase [Diaporthe ampelina]
MILGPVSYLDCIVFCTFLAPQLILNVGLFETVVTVLQVLPFLVFELPVTFLYERYFLKKEEQPEFVQQASPFEDFVVRCVRYAFANIPPKVGRVFFGKNVALPLSPNVVKYGRPLTVFQGGGFSMGSPYFYLEFLLTWLSLLKRAGYKNPAIFGLDYTLVPDSSFPTQLAEMVSGYEHVLSMAGSDPSIVCIAGDSAGGTLTLSLLLHLAHPVSASKGRHLPEDSRHLGKPGMAVLISPWPTLQSALYQNNRSDFLDVPALHLYAAQYAGRVDLLDDPVASPGNLYGKEEVFAPEIEKFVQRLDKAGTLVTSQCETGGIHAWPVASLFLSSTEDQRVKGLGGIVKEILSRVPPSKS